MKNGSCKLILEIIGVTTVSCLQKKIRGSMIALSDHMSKQMTKVELWENGGHDSKAQPVERALWEAGFLGNSRQGCHSPRTVSWISNS